jgi:hypothetical protein
MKPIALEVSPTTLTNGVDKNGDFSFYVYTTNLCDDEIEKAIDTLKLIWEAPIEVSLSINLTLKGVYRDVHEMYRSRDGTVHPEDAHHFAAVRKDCQWIIDQIDAMESLK